MIQRDAAILKNGKLYVELQGANKRPMRATHHNGGAMEVVQSVVPPPHAIPQPTGMTPMLGMPKGSGTHPYWQIES